MGTCAGTPTKHHGNFRGHPRTRLGRDSGLKLHCARWQEELLLRKLSLKMQNKPDRCISGEAQVPLLALVPGVNSGPVFMPGTKTSRGKVLQLPSKSISSPATSMGQGLLGAILLHMFCDGGYTSQRSSTAVLMIGCVRVCAGLRSVGPEARQVRWAKEEDSPHPSLKPRRPLSAWLLQRLCLVPCAHRCAPKFLLGSKMLVLGN